MTPNQARPQPVAEPLEGTRLESDEEIRQALQARRARVAAPAPAANPGAQAKAPIAVLVEIEPQAEQPVLRPPVALLCVLDDGKADGEWVRLRADRTVIGRTEGDVRIPHDGAVSGQHAELVRQRVAAGFRWFLVDLRSTNGTFVRIGSTLLRHESEFLIGAGRYRFEAAAAAAAAAPDPPGTLPQTTQAWSGTPIHALMPSLVETGPAGPVRRINLTLPEYWIGRDVKSCPIARPDDVFVNARHARLHRDAKGQWHVENNKSLNGLWLRIVEPMPLGSACQFRMGEQRFIFRMK